MFVGRVVARCARGLAGHHLAAQSMSSDLVVGLIQFLTPVLGVGVVWRLLVELVGS